MKNLLKNDGAQSFIASIICIILGLFVGFIVLLFINPSGAFTAIITVIKNFLYYPSGAAKMKYFGNTLVKTAPLLMCSLSILFAYKVGLFNIGASGQYTAGTCVALLFALKFGWGWLPCMILAVLAGVIMGTIVGMLKSKFNVNEVISGIMLNWIMLYLCNMILTSVKESTSPYTYNLRTENPKAIIPSLGLDKLFADNMYVSIAIPLSIIFAILVYVVLEKTTLGYELKASGFNKHAAKYAGMNGKRNIILTLAIAGGLSGMGAALFFLTGFEQWQCTASSVPAMGFNGIAAAFPGGLNPIGAIFSSFFIQHITNGGAYVDKTMYCAQISDLISAIIIYLCGFVLFLKMLMAKLAAKKSEGGEA